jgi:hypothetical protein
MAVNSNPPIEARTFMLSRYPAIPKLFSIGLTGLGSRLKSLRSIVSIGRARKGVRILVTGISDPALSFHSALILLKVAANSTMK